MAITTIDEIKRMANSGEEINLPPFNSGEVITVKVKRPSMMTMLSKGKIPNALMGTALKLFNSVADESDLTDLEFVKQSQEIMEIMADAVLVQPTFKELTDAGVELTDEQLAFLYTYSQRGINQADPFRELEGNIEHDTSSDDVSPKTE